MSTVFAFSGAGARRAPPGTGGACRAHAPPPPGAVGEMLAQTSNLCRKPWTRCLANRIRCSTRSLGTVVRSSSFPMPPGGHTCPRRRPAGQEEKAYRASRRGAAAWRAAARSIRHIENGPGSVPSQDRATDRRRSGGVRHRRGIDHSDLPPAPPGPAVCGGRRRGIRKPVATAARQKV